MTQIRQLLTIELSGLPSTGKTTTAGLLKEHFFELGVRCQVVSSAADIGSPVQNKLSYEYDAWAGCRAVMELVSARQSDELQILIFDRGLVDTTCWLEYFSKMNMESKRSTEIFSEFLMLERWFLPLYFNYTLLAELDTVISRRKNLNGVVKEKHHTDLKSIYETVANSKDLQELCELSVIINTDTKTIQEIVDQIVSDLRPFI